mmetsp:Transcript_43715/g.106870  ORF Transcript_43715/g.106870 Transcript_43715/m.106870 type:complete len:222 (-) Transcript_43715:253-918(-)
MSELRRLRLSPCASSELASTMGMMGTMLMLLKEANMLLPKILCVTTARGDPIVLLIERESFMSMCPDTSCELVFRETHETLRLGAADGPRETEREIEICCADVHSPDCAREREGISYTSAAPVRPDPHTACSFTCARSSEWLFLHEAESVGWMCSSSSNASSASLASSVFFDFGPNCSSATPLMVRTIPSRKSTIWEGSTRQSNSRYTQATLPTLTHVNSA